jgi:hypothetical protein
MSAVIDTLLSATDPEYLRQKLAKIDQKPTSKRVTNTVKPASKTEIAREVFIKHGGSRKLVIAELVETHKMSKAGATTYFYNAKKSV